MRKRKLPATLMGLSLSLAGCALGSMSGDKDDYSELKRPDGAIVRCQVVPLEIVNKANKLNVDATVKGVQLAVISAGVGIDLERITQTSVSLNDYRVVSRQLCLDYASGVYTAEQYRTIRERVLPALQKKAETEARVDSDLEVGTILSYPGRVRVPVTLRVRSVDMDNLKAAHVIFVLMVAHNEDQLPPGLEYKPSSRSCAEVPSCLGHRLWNQVSDPIVVRGADDVGASVGWTFDVKEGVRAARVFWETYQREADHGGRCVVDEDSAGPSGGIPYLKVLDPVGKVVPRGTCYRSYGAKVIPLV